MCGVGKIYCQLLQNNHFAFTVFISIYKFLFCYQKGSTTNTFSQSMVLMLNTCLSWTDISLHLILNTLSLSSPGIARTSWYLLLKLCFPFLFWKVSFFNNYLLDPKRPQLPEHPGNKQTGPSTSGGQRDSLLGPGNANAYQGLPQMLAYNQPRPPLLYAGNLLTPKSNIVFRPLLCFFSFKLFYFCRIV